MSASPLSRPSRFASYSAIPSKVRSLILVSIPTNVASGFFFIVVSSYLLMVGLSAELVGLILGVSGVSMILSAIPLGLLSDRKGRKLLLLLGAVGFPPVLLIFAFTTNPLWLLLAGILSGLGEAAFLSTWNALIADGTPLGARNAAFSLSFIVGTTTSGIGFAFPFFFPLLEGWLGLNVFTLHKGFLVIFALLAALTPILFRLFLWDMKEVLHPRTIRGTRRGGRVVLWELKGVLRPRKAWERRDVRTWLWQLRSVLGPGWAPAKRTSLVRLFRFSVINSLIGLGAGFIIPLIPTWLFLKFGATDAFSGPLLAVSNVVMGVAAVGSASLAKRRGPVRAIVLTQGLSTVFMLSLAFVPSLILAGALYIVRAALMNMGSPIMDSYLMGIVAPEDRGFASAVNSIIWRLPNSLSTVAGGFLLMAGLYQIPFFIAALLYAGGISLFFTVFRNVAPKN